MSLIAMDEGKKRALELFIANEPMTMRLFQNDYTPVHDSILASFTECSFAGYDGKFLAGGIVDPAVDANKRAVATFNQLTWTKNGTTGNSVFGYYITNNQNKVLMAERFAAVEDMTVDGKGLTITPKISQRSQFSNG